MATASLGLLIALGAAACCRAVPALTCRAAPAVAAQDLAPPGPPLSLGVWGRLDPNMLLRVQSINAVEQVHMGVSSDGRIAELSIYHNDPSPIPKPVRALLREEFPNHRLISYETQWGDTAWVEVTVRTAQGRICALSATPSGEVRYTECLIDVTELPATVAQALESAMPAARVQECVMRQEAAGRVYKVTVRHGTRLHQLQYTSEGELRAHHIRVPATLLLAE